MLPRRRVRARQARAEPPDDAQICGTYAQMPGGVPCGVCSWRLLTALPRHLKRFLLESDIADNLQSFIKDAGHE
jgi:hypothetical protein